MSRRNRIKPQVKAVKAQIKAVQAILRRWDPIGVAPGKFAPADEYDAYAPQIVSQVMKGCSLAALAQELSMIRIREMGMAANPLGDRATALEILHALQPFGQQGASHRD